MCPLCLQVTQAFELKKNFHLDEIAQCCMGNESRQQHGLNLASSVGYVNSLHTGIYRHLNFRQGETLSTIQDLQNKRFTIQQIITLPDFCYKILKVKNAIWCFCQKKIAILDFSGKHLTTQILPKFLYGCKEDAKFHYGCKETLGSAETVNENGDVLIASPRTGVQIYLQLLNHWEMINKSLNIFCSAHIRSNKTFLTLSKGKKQINVKIYERDMKYKPFHADEEHERWFSRQTKIKTALKLDCIAGLTSALLNNELYVCPNRHGCVYKLDGNGQIIHEYSHALLRWPLICGSDSSGCILVADYLSNSLLVLKPDDTENPWTTVNIEGGIMGPTSAVIADGCLFCVGHRWFTAPLIDSRLYICSPTAVK